MHVIDKIPRPVRRWPSNVGWNDEPVDIEQLIEEGLKSFCHIPILEADVLFQGTRAKRYRVETINWTYATDHTPERKILGASDPGGRRIRQEDRKNLQVHRNVYSFTLDELVRFMRDTAKVAEDIIDIHPE